MPEPKSRKRRKSDNSTPASKNGSAAVTLEEARSAASPASETPSRFSDTAAALLLGVVVILVLLATRPFSGLPMNDDFSYARTAQAFAETGRIVYNGWGSPLLLPQILYGALAIKLFGFSYGILTATGIFFAGAATAAMYLLARACGCPHYLSVLATCLLTLNPMFLSVAPSFMTDVPSLFLMLAALLTLVKALQTDAEGRVRLDGRRFLVSVLLGIVAGSNRQILWVAYLGALAMLLLLPGERRRVLPAIMVVLGCAAALTIWFNRQPYTVPAGMGMGLQTLLLMPNVAFMFIYKFLNMLGLFLFPMVLAALWRRQWRYLLLAALLFFCLLPLFYSFQTKNIQIIGDTYWLTVYGQYFTSSGAVVGGVHGFEKRPVVLSPAMIAGLVLAGALGLALSGYLFLDWWEEIGQSIRKRITRQQIAVSAVAISSVAQILASLPWYATMTVFDRYLLLLLPGFLILHAAQAANRAHPLLIRAATGLMAILAIIGFLFTSEYMAYTQARATLYNRLLARGVAPRAIEAGFEMNSDTQVQLGGYINNPLIKNPPGAYREGLRSRYIIYMPEYFPDMDVHYLLSTQRNPPPEHVLPDPVDSVTYHSLLPPRRRTMYVYRIRR